MEPQTVVVTGASAGIGRATARLFGERGASVGLIARGEAGLDGAVRDVEEAGGKALAVSADMADYAQVTAAARQIEEHFGPIDVWVNVAFTSVFAPFAEIAAEEFRRVTEVSYLGFVHGTMAALTLMRPRGRGTIVQVGSALGERSIPLQSAYCGAKHAINGFTSSLRCELLHENSGVHVTVVQMPAVNTPQFSWVRSRLPKDPQPVPPIYQPEPPAASCSPPTIPAGGSTGWGGAPRPPSLPTGWLRLCWTGTWPAPATAPSRPRSRPGPAGRTTWFSRLTEPTGMITAHVVPSTAGPISAARSCGSHSTPAWPRGPSPGRRSWGPSWPGGSGAAGDASDPATWPRPR
jgi:NAD(P)-dependent dehydrogenase (short-subunit alcohol dehydrogenase family)